MRVGPLLSKEAAHRPWGLVAGLLAIAVACGCLIGAMTAIRGNDVATAAKLDDHEAQTAAAMAKLKADTEAKMNALKEGAQERMDALKNSARIFAKSLGHNVLILPQKQDLGAFYGDDRSTAYFTRAEAMALAESEPYHLNHLMPLLRHRMTWEEQNIPAILVGIEGQIYIQKSFQKPIQKKIEPGMVSLGAALADIAEAKVGSTITVAGKEFTVEQVNKTSGTKDDISMLMHVDDLEAISGLNDKVSGILGLTCNCKPGDLAPVIADVHKALPEAQVVEFATLAKARSDARAAAAKAAREEIFAIKDNALQMEEAIATSSAENAARIEANGAYLRNLLTITATVVVGLVTLTGAILIAILMMVNVRERRSEIAILRALGASGPNILQLFMGKALIVGIGGGLIGTLAGALVGWGFSGSEFGQPAFTEVVPVLWLGLIPVLALLVALAASAIPTLIAANQDPASILNQEG